MFFKQNEVLYLDNEEVASALRKLEELIQTISIDIATLKEQNISRKDANELFRAEMQRRVTKLEESHTVLVNKDELSALTLEVEGMKRAVYGAMALAVILLPVVVMIIEELLQRML